MTQVDEVERLQIELSENPKSLNFIRLAEKYLERDMASEAESLVRRSLKFHANSVSGLALLARSLRAQNRSDEALPYLDQATKLAPDNWKAWLEQAEIFAELHHGKKALKSFKQVLLLNPTHPLARRAVAKLEVLSADEYEDDLFSMQPLNKAELKEEASTTAVTEWTKIPTSLERVLALVDALTVRLDTKKALDLLNDCTKKYGSHPEIDSRRLRLSTYDTPDYIQPKSQKKSSLAKQELLQQKKISVLEELLRRIEVIKTQRLST